MPLMPELQEMAVISRLMNKEIAGKRIVEVEAKQPKNLNLPVKRFLKVVKGCIIEKVSYKGKWIFIKLKSDDK
jgi:formamidopyrimidine-DNA glycosylase